MRKYLLITIVILLAVCGSLFELLKESRKECDRLNANNHALNEGMITYKNRLGESVASVERLSLTKKELERDYAALCEEARQLGVKVRWLQSTSLAAMSTELVAETKVKDSIVWRDRPDTVKVFEWIDPWACVTGVIDSGRVSLDMHCADTLIQIVHRVPKKFLWFRFGTKAIRQEIVSKNPHTAITYTEYIEIGK